MIEQIEIALPGKIKKQEFKQKILGTIFQLYLFTTFETKKAQLAEDEEFREIEFNPLFVLAITTDRQNKTVFRLTTLDDYCFDRFDEQGKTDARELQLLGLASVKEEFQQIWNYYKEFGYSGKQIRIQFNKTRESIRKIIKMGDYKQFACEYIKSSKKVLEKQKTLDFVLEFFSEILGEDFVPIEIDSYVSQQEQKKEDDLGTVDSVQNSDDVPRRPNLRKKQQKARKIEEKKKKQEKPKKKIDISLWKKKLRMFKKKFYSTNSSSLDPEQYEPSESIVAGNEAEHTHMLQHQSDHNLNDNQSTEGQINLLNSTVVRKDTSGTVVVATSVTLIRRQDENNQRIQQPNFDGEDDQVLPPPQTINQNQYDMINQLSSPHHNNLNNSPSIMPSPVSYFRQQSPIFSGFCLQSNDEFQELRQLREKDNSLPDQEQNVNDISLDLDFELQQQKVQFINRDTSNNQGYSGEEISNQVNQEMLDFLERQQSTDQFFQKIFNESN